MTNKTAKAIKNSRLAGTKQLLATASGDATPGNAAGITQANASAHHQSAQVVALDLDGNNSITVTTRAQGGSVLIDVDDDGFTDEVNWIAPREGLLVLDRNNDGRISGGHELFTDSSVNVLAEIDANGDGLRTNADAVFSHLQVWQDINHDGQAQAYELQSRQTLGISQINYQSAQFTQGAIIKTLAIADAANCYEVDSFLPNGDGGYRPIIHNGLVMPANDWDWRVCA